MSQIRKLVGSNIRRYRKQRGWTQEQLALYAKVGFSYLNQLELGNENVSVETLAKIAKSLKIEVHLLLQSSTDNPTAETGLSSAKK